MCPTNTLFSNKFIIKNLLLILLTYPITAEGLQLNGLSTYSELGKEQFIVGLHATNYGSSSHDMLGASNEKKIEIKVVYDQLSIRRFKRMWIEGLAINLRSNELKKHAENMAKFSNMLNVNLKTNDIIVIQELPDSLAVLINGITLGRLSNPLFMDQLLRVFIGDVPLSTKFKKDLLVAGDIEPQLLSKFRGIYPTNDRIEAIRYSINKKSNETLLASNTAIDNVVPESTRSEDKIKNIPKINKKPEPIVLAENTVKPVIKNVASVSQPTLPAYPKSNETNKVKEVSEAKKVSEVKETIQPELLSQTESIIDDTDIKFTADDILKEQMYYLNLTKYTQGYVRYPKVSMARGHEGSLLIRTTIDRKGNVLNTEIIEETNHKALNKEALKAIKRASPYPPIPESIIDDVFSFSVVITFGLSG